MQNLFAFLTLALLLSVAFFAHYTGMAAENFYVLLIAMAAYLTYTLVKGHKQQPSREHCLEHTPESPDE